MCVVHQRTFVNDSVIDCYVGHTHPFPACPNWISLFGLFPLNSDFRAHSVKVSHTTCEYTVDRKIQRILKHRKKNQSTNKPLKRRKKANRQPKTNNQDKTDCDTRTSYTHTADNTHRSNGVHLFSPIGKTIPLSFLSLSLSLQIENYFRRNDFCFSFICATLERFAT